MKIEIEIDEVRELAYNNLKEEFPEIIDRELEGVVKNRIVALYDNRDRLRELQNQASE